MAAPRLNTPTAVAPPVNGFVQISTSPSVFIRRAWRPSEFPDGMLRAYECFAEDRNEVVGISIWESLHSRDRYRLSEVEAARQRAMAPFVEAESSGVYSGRELRIPVTS